MFRKHLFILFLFLCKISYSQTSVKFNGLSALVLIPNIGIETPLSNKFTLQVDVAASFWKSVNGGPFQFVTLTPELRYHFKENSNGFYIGTHLGGSIFKVQKWNYSDTDHYQKGINYFVGGTIGYQLEITQKIGLDVFLGGGTQQAFYKGYDESTNTRYETAKDYNKSGEWIPYRGGIMICYKIN